SYGDAHIANVKMQREWWEKQGLGLSTSMVFVKWMELATFARVCSRLQDVAQTVAAEIREKPAVPGLINNELMDFVICVEGVDGAKQPGPPPSELPALLRRSAHHQQQHISTVDQPSRTSILGTIPNAGNRQQVLLPPLPVAQLLASAGLVNLVLPDSRPETFFSNVRHHEEIAK
ncbi:unnamed protein product, partial [Heterosigma akashiwo]